MKGNVIIIGASSGIGKQLARVFAKNGYKVAITGRRGGLLEETKNEFPGNIITSCFDINHESASSCIDSLISRLGGLDIFIYSAGIVELTQRPDWEIDHTMIQTNITAFAKCAGKCFNYFLARNHGQFVAISSIAGIRGGSSSPVYNASKAFQSNLCESMYLQALNLGKNIAVTDIQPGFVDTSMAKGDKRFWVMPVGKVCMQIYNAIVQRKKTVVVTGRWRLVAMLLKYIPDFLFLGLMKRRMRMNRVSE